MKTKKNIQISKKTYRKFAALAPTMGIDVDKLIRNILKQQAALLKDGISNPKEKLVVEFTEAVERIFA